MYDTHTPRISPATDGDGVTGAFVVVVVVGRVVVVTVVFDVVRVVALEAVVADAVGRTVEEVDSLGVVDTVVSVADSVVESDGSIVVVTLVAVVLTGDITVVCEEVVNSGVGSVLAQPTHKKTDNSIAKPIRIRFTKSTP